MYFAKILFMKKFQKHHLWFIKSMFHHFLAINLLSQIIRLDLCLICLDWLLILLNQAALNLCAQFHISKGFKLQDMHYLIIFK